MNAFDIKVKIGVRDNKLTIRQMTIKIGKACTINILILFHAAFKSSFGLGQRTGCR